MHFPELAGASMFPFHFTVVHNKLQSLIMCQRQSNVPTTEEPLCQRRLELALADSSIIVSVYHIKKILSYGVKQIIILVDCSGGVRVGRPAITTRIW